MQPDDGHAGGTRPSMKCYRKNGSDVQQGALHSEQPKALNEVLPKER